MSYVDSSRVVKLALLHVKAGVSLLSETQDFLRADLANLVRMCQLWIITDLDASCADCSRGRHISGASIH